MIWYFIVGVGAFLAGSAAGVYLGLRLADNAVMSSIRW